MHKRTICLTALLLAAVLLCSCSAAAYIRKTEEPQLLFYYRAADGAGSLVTQQVSLSDRDPAAVLQQYLNLSGLAERGAALPEGLDGCSILSYEDGVLSLQLEKAPPDRLQSSLTAACLTLTLTQLEDVSRVRLVYAEPSSEAAYTADQFLLYDAAADLPEFSVRLYYPDRDGLLIAQEAVVRTASEEQLPLLALQALLSREIPAGLSRAVPYQTKVLDLSVTGGTASLVLSDAFMSCDTSSQQAANAVRSIAATLCALSGVQSVQLSVIGETGLTYYDISQPIVPQSDWYAEK